MKYPNRVVAQAMNIGEYSDVQTLVKQVEEDYLKQVIASAEAGQFSEKSWYYLHYRLRLAGYGQVPPMPARKVE